MKKQKTKFFGTPRLLRVFARHKLGIVGLIALSAFIAIAIFAPVLVRFDPYTMDLEHAFLPAGSGGHLLGTDNFGRDDDAD